MADAREVFEGFRHLLRQQPSPTNRRNAVRTFHDFLKILLRSLAEPAEEKFLGQVDILKRFTFIVIKFPELEPFRDLVTSCKSARDKVDHHDSDAPPASQLASWGERAQAMQEEVERCRQLRSEQHERVKSGRMLTVFLLLEALEETERLVTLLRERLSVHGLTEKQIEEGKNLFRGLYGPYYSWTDRKLDSASEYELAQAIAVVARKNGLFTASVLEIADVFSSFLRASTQSIH